MHYGNLQKIRDGKRTFGITPDIPSGFIQPETLEKIAKVAKKYKAVLKIWKQSQSYLRVFEKNQKSIGTDLNKNLLRGI